MRGGSLLLFLLLFYFFPSPSIRSGEAFSSVIFSSPSLLLFVFGCCDGMEREACVCGSRIIIIIIIGENNNNNNNSNNNNNWRDCMTINKPFRIGH